jgi:phospholipid/cholesterol/gamma-HCH transport system permease protein
MTTVDAAEGGTPTPQAPPQPAARAKLLAPVREAGELSAFSLRALVALRHVWHYSGEMLRQCSTLILGSALIICAMQFVIGGECALFGNYLLRSFGASASIGSFTEICDVRELFPYMFGYIFAAKVGCGLVAEIGSMRISEELDALESVGMDPMAYVVGTRLMAAILCIPVIYLISMLVGTAGSYVVVVIQVHEISAGGWAAGHWTYQDLSENIYSLAKAMIIGIAIVLVGLYYGYRARGGPVGVGAATARSMILNLVLIHVLGAATSTLFWGTSARTPVGG